jgi:antitoxin StbD
MINAAEIVNNLVSITQFNKGQASKIFDFVKTKRWLIVLKNNNPSAVILAPEEYSRLVEIEKDYRLMCLAIERLKANQGKEGVPFADVLKKYGINMHEIESADDLEIELRAEKRRKK